MKKGFLIILLLIIFFGLAASIQAAEEKKTTIVPYLELPGAENPTGGIPQYIRYIFIFSLGVVGIVAFIAMLVAAFQYVTSVGNPQKASDAKDRIFSALLGMLLLFGSYLLLNTINPDLLKFKTEIAGEKLDFPVEGDKPVTGCRLTAASWDKAIINAGENAILSFHLASECFDESSPLNCTDDGCRLESWPAVWQQRPKGKDAHCGEYYTWDLTDYDNLQKTLAIKLQHDFKSECNETWIGTPISACAGTPGIICNFINGKPEEFYLEGWVKLKGLPKQYIPRLKINVRDLENGVCCR